MNILSLFDGMIELILFDGMINLIKRGDNHGIHLSNKKYRE